MERDPNTEEKPESETEQAPGGDKPETEKPEPAEGESAA